MGLRDRIAKAQIGKPWRCSICGVVNNADYCHEAAPWFEVEDTRPAWRKHLQAKDLTGALR